MTLGAAVLLLSAAPPALASTTAHGCTVAPTRPALSNGNTLVRYTATASCKAGRYLQVEQTFYERDGSQYTYLGQQVWTSEVKAAEKFSHFTDQPIPDTEPGDEELYQTVRFRVMPFGGDWSKWTSREFSARLTVPQPQ